MFHVVLYQPEIPPNTGNIVRLCVNTGAKLHLIRPLGFSIDDKQLRRAGLDYRERAELRQYDSLDDCCAAIQPARLFACTTRGQQRYTDVIYEAGDALLFGPETRGLPQALLDALPPPRLIRIPMIAGNRSLNLSNAAAVILYEAWRQNDFANAT